MPPQPPVLHSFAYGLDYLREQVADVSADGMVTQPAHLPNHAAWTLGHVGVTCQMLGEVLGLPAWLPDDWPRRHGSGSRPTADVRAYDDKAELLARLDETRARITAGVTALEPARRAAPFPDPAYLDVFPTLDHALTQVLVAHTAQHIGQLAVWRKASGLPPMTRSFE